MEREREVILRLPPLPTAPAVTLLKAPLLSPLEPTPSKEIVSVAVIFTLPASPCPRVLATRTAPLDTDRERVERLISPPLPTAPASTRLAALLDCPLVPTPSKEIESVAARFTRPAFPLPLVLAFS